MPHPSSTVPFLCQHTSALNGAKAGGQSLPNALQMRSSASAEEQLVLCTLTVLIKSLSHTIRAQITSLKPRTGRGLSGVSVQNDLSSSSLFHAPVNPTLALS